MGRLAHFSIRETDMSSTRISRRRVLTHAAGGLAAATAAQSLAGSANAQQQSGKSATFVLVPGAWHGAWCYRRVAKLLTARGHEVYALTLTGLADRSHLASDAVNMTTHIKDVANFVKWEGLSGIVLVGHSYGGLVITGAAEEIGPDVASIVYLDAFIPENGQSMADIVKRPLPTTGFAPPFPAKAMKVNAKDEAWVDAKMTPQPINTYLQKLTLSGAYTKIPKKTYVRSTEFNQPIFQKHYEELKQKSEWQTFTMNCGHDVMVDKPDELADILVRVS
jgi:pimeloyl-ACP methyl ester carboxylesterase